jgi:nucleotidyltransferase substrate binding protein (TIGR01987 family)
LKKSAALPGSAMARTRPELREGFRAAAIQAFERSCELAIRTMRRGLETMVSAPAEIDQMPFKTLMRTAAGLIDGPPAWMAFRDKRNITSHTCDETKASAVFAVIPQFIERATFPLNRLGSLNDASR